MERTFVITVQDNGDYELWEARETESRIVTGDVLLAGALVDDRLAWELSEVMISRSNG